MFDLSDIFDILCYIFAHNGDEPFKDAINEVMWKNIVERGGTQMTIWCIACWIPKATNTHTQAV